MGCGSSAPKTTEMSPAASEEHYKTLFQATVEAGRKNGDSEEKIAATLLKEVFGPGKAGRTLHPAEATFYEGMCALSSPRDFLSERGNEGRGEIELDGRRYGGASVDEDGAEAPKHGGGGEEHAGATGEILVRTARGADEEERLMPHVSHQEHEEEEGDEEEEAQHRRGTEAEEEEAAEGTDTSAAGAGETEATRVNDAHSAAPPPAAAADET